MSSTFNIPDGTYIIITRDGKMKVSYCNERIYFHIPDQDALKIIDTIEYNKPEINL